MSELLKKENIDKVANSTKTGFVFVYGTLKVGGHFAATFDNDRISSIPAEVPGTMYATAGWYPGCVFDTKHTIVGELHEYKDIDAIMKRQDIIEGCNGGTDPSNLYNRRTIIVITNDGEEIEALTYEYNRDVNGLKIIETGIWAIKAAGFVN